MLVNASAEQQKAEAVPAPKWHLRAVRVQQRAPPGQCSSRDGTDGLAAPAVADRLGNLYNKEPLVEALLHKRLPRALSHIRGLRDMVPIHLHPRPGADAAGDEVRFQCPVTGLEFNGKYQFLALSVPATADPNDGHYKSEDGSTAYLAKSRYSYDEAADTLTDTTTGVVYTANNKIGAFVDADGNQIDPGWRVFVGFDNYMNMFARGDLAGPFLKALLWSFVFAAVSVLSTFALGLILGLVFADKRIKGRKIYQSLMILPYAFPAFLATLVWKGMLNTDFGLINQVFLGGVSIPWLTDGTLAKFSILGVNLWLGFPYMFLVCLGALQSLPGDVEEAAKIDGASGLRTVWSIKLPLVLQSTVPLLIASFAFNFNNFSLIYMLTGGGPNYPGMDVGQTDILISMVYKIAIESGSPNYGLASAMSIVIFIVVGVIAWLGFRQTKTLEEL